MLTQNIVISWEAREASQLITISKSNRPPAATGDWEHVNKELVNYGYSPVVLDVEKKCNNNMYTL